MRRGQNIKGGSESAGPCWDTRNASDSDPPPQAVAGCIPVCDTVWDPEKEVQGLHSQLKQSTLGERVTSSPPREGGAKIGGMNANGYPRDSVCFQNED